METLFGRLNGGYFWRMILHWQQANGRIMAKSKKFYTVWRGRQPGVYDTWEACQAQIKDFPGAKYKSFPSLEDAQQAFEQGPSPSAPRPVAKPKSRLASAAGVAFIRQSISVDAACSGNPGEMEYQGVYTDTGEQIFHQKFPLGTNNIGEFLAIVHALALCHRQQSNTPIYTDSQTAIGWVRRKHCKTQLPRNTKTERLYELIDRAETWLKTHTWSNPLLKWDTENWGEIPADFGRKK